MILITLTFICLLYLFTLTNTIYGGDAGDLLSAIVSIGQIHPPGYSFYTLLGIIANKLPIVILTPAGKVTLISLFSTIFSLIIFYLIIKEVLPKKFFLQGFAVLTMLILAFNYVVWLYAVVPEVFPLNTLITLLIFYCFIKLTKTKKNSYFYWLGLLLGLGISHHHTFILISPSLIYLYLKFKSNFGDYFKIKKMVIFALFFILGLTPLLYLIYTSFVKSEYIWGDGSTLPGFFAILSRRVYGTFVPGNFISNLPFHRFLQFKFLLTFTIFDFTFLGLLLFLAGLIFYLKSKDKKTKYYLTAVLINIFFFGPFYLFYANFPLTDKFLFATLERFLLVYYFFFSIFIYLGIYLSFDWIKTKFALKIIKNKQIFSFFLTSFLILLCFLPMALLWRNYRFIKPLKNSRIAENLGVDILKNLPKKSIIFLSQDTTLFNTQYVYYTFPQIAKDKILVHISKYLLIPVYKTALIKKYPQIMLKQDMTLTEFVKKNIGSYQIYSNEIFDLPNLADYEWVNKGILFEVVKKNRLDQPLVEKEINNFWNKSQNSYLPRKVKSDRFLFKNLFLNEVLRIYSDAHLNTAHFFINQNKFAQAEKHINQSSLLNPGDPDQAYLLSLISQKKGECMEAKDYIIKAIKKKYDPVYINHLRQIGLDCNKNKKK